MYGEHHRFGPRLGHISGLAQVSCAFINSLVSLNDQVCRTDPRFARDEWADFLFGSVGKMVNDCPGAGSKKKRKKVRDRGGQPASEARHHGLRWDQIRWCVSEDLFGGLIGVKPVFGRRQD